MGRYSPGMTTSPVKDLCRATERHRGQTKVCQLPIHHQDDHKDAVGHTWPQEQAPPYQGERVFL